MTETAESTAEEAPSLDEGGSAKRVVRVPLGALIWGAAVVVAVLLLAWLIYFQYRPDQQTDSAQQESAVAAARDGVAAVYTYSADTLDRDISSAQSHLTGDFLSEYQQYVNSPAPTEAKQNAVRTAAKVSGSALVDIQPGTAQVLLFINQTTTSAQNPATTLASRSVVVTLLKVDDKWLISSMKPA
ncbi:MAG: Mce-associated rane protein [Mycobacterium sp.]|nr:Mce-associated rane protein [Mycobacterium sp.]